MEKLDKLVSESQEREDKQVTEVFPLKQHLIFYESTT